MTVQNTTTAAPIHAPHGTALTCKGWPQEAALRMLMNNLDPDVAERPEDLVVYGGSGRAARSWEAFDAIVAAVFVRTASGSGAQDLPAPLATLLEDIGRRTAGTPRPFVTVFFGNPYATMATPRLPAILLTYDFYDLAERSAVRALAGEVPITGVLPISIPGLFDRRHGIVR